MATRFVRIAKFCQETGYTDRAVETKIHRGVWIEGREYVRAPDNNIVPPRSAGTPASPWR